MQRSRRSTFAGMVDQLSTKASANKAILRNVDMARTFECSAQPFVDRGPFGAADAISRENRNRRSGPGGEAAD
jgi:hypothetical protein